MESPLLLSAPGVPAHPAAADRFREVVRVLVARNVRHRYRGSAFGVLWSLANPVAMTALYAAIFGRTFAPYFGGSLTRYGLSVFIGLSVVGFFVTSTSQALTTIVGGAALLQRLNLPKSAFPVASVIANSAQLFVGTLPVLVIAGIFSGATPGTLVLLPIVLALLTAFCVGVGLVTATAYVFFRDVPYMYELFTFLIWVASPVFYPFAIVPHAVARVIALNPMYVYLSVMRQLMVGVLDPLGLVKVVLEAAASLVIGILIFRSGVALMMDRL